MEEHEVRLVHANDGWYIYQDGVQVIGGFFVPRDRIIAKIEAKKLAKKLSPCELRIIGYSGIEESKEYF